MIRPSKYTPIGVLRHILGGQPSGGYFFVAVKRCGVWREAAIKNDGCLSAKLDDWLKRHPVHHYDLYFCPHTFSAPKRTRENARPSFYAHCDVDEGNPHLFKPSPSFITETSPGRTQALWKCRELLSVDEVEAISKHLTYTFGGDRNGWSITKYLRAPLTRNHKRSGEPPIVKIIADGWRSIGRNALLDKVIVGARPTQNNSTGDDFANLEVAIRRDPVPLLRRYRREISRVHFKAYVLLSQTRQLERDRSGAIYFLISTLLEAGLAETDIATLVSNSVYFRSKHGVDVRALAAELARCKAKREARK